MTPRSDLALRKSLPYAVLTTPQGTILSFQLIYSQTLTGQSLPQKNQGAEAALMHEMVSEV